MDNTGCNSWLALTEMIPKVTVYEVLQRKAILAVAQYKHPMKSPVAIIFG